MKTSSLATRDGYTLVELLIAMVLLAVGFLSVITVLWASAKGGTTSRNMTVAASAAQDIFERCNGLPMAAMPKTSGFAPYTATSPATSGLLREWQVEDDVPEKGAKTITVRISWSQQGGSKKRSYTMVRRGDF